MSETTAKLNTMTKKGIVKESCGANMNGVWYCITHDEILGSNLQAFTHVDTGKHVTAWLCFEHGLEEAES